MSLAVPICWTCGAFGHLSWDCPRSRPLDVTWFTSAFHSVVPAHSLFTYPMTRSTSLQTVPSQDQMTGLFSSIASLKRSFSSISVAASRPTIYNGQWLPAKKPSHRRRQSQGSRRRGKCSRRRTANSFHPTTHTSFLPISLRTCISTSQE